MESPGKRSRKQEDADNTPEPKTLPEVDSSDESANDLGATPPASTAGDSSRSNIRRRIASLGDFELFEKIGAGAMGAVFRAKQVSKSRPAAVKVLKPHLAEDPLFLQRFVREAELMGRLRHPNIVRCYCMGKQSGRYYIAMELVEGRTLGEWLVTLGKLSMGDALHVTTGVARALQHAHQNGLIHRDVKPNNILITRDGRIKLADMGLARSVLEEDSEATQEGHGAGTPVYVSPEQARDARDADPRSDLYSLGCMFYQMLTGEAPFKGPKSLDIILAKIEGRYIPARVLLPDLPIELDELLCSLLGAHPDDRYQSASDLLSDLEQWNVSASLSFVKSPSEPSTLNDEEAVLTDGDLESTDADTTSAPAAFEKRWYVLSLTEEGEWLTQRLTTGQVLGLLPDEQFARTASASLFRGSYRPLEEIAEFREALAQCSPVLTPAKFIEEMRPTLTSPAPSQQPAPANHPVGRLLLLLGLALALGFTLGYLLTR